MSILDHEQVMRVTEAKARELLTKRESSPGSSEEPPPILSEVLEALYASEINASVAIESFWDGGWYWTIKLGDALNGYDAQQTFTQEEFKPKGALWLITEAVRQYRHSVFATKYAPALKQHAEEQSRTIERGPHSLESRS